MNMLIFFVWIDDWMIYGLIILCWIKEMLCDGIIVVNDKVVSNFILKEVYKVVV